MARSNQLVFVQMMHALLTSLTGRGEKEGVRSLLYSLAQNNQSFKTSWPRYEIEPIRIAMACKMGIRLESLRYLMTVEVEKSTKVIAYHMV